MNRRTFLKKFTITCHGDFKFDQSVVGVVEDQVAKASQMPFLIPSSSTIKKNLLLTKQLHFQTGSVQSIAKVTKKV